MTKISNDKYYTPNNLAKRLIETTIKVLVENGVTDITDVIEPFMGSGSCGVASKELGRDFIGIELDETYFNNARNRINEQN